MSEYEVCKNCGKIAYLEHSKTTSMEQAVHRKNWKLYCSKACRYEDTWKRKKFWAYVFFIIAGLFLFGLPDGLVGTLIFAVFGILFIKLAHFERDYALRGGPKEPRKQSKVNWRKRRNNEERRRPSRSNTLTPIPTQINPDISNPNVTYMYSEILQDKVLKCCYQSARLNDKYCVCGRALEYPPTT